MAAGLMGAPSRSKEDERRRSPRVTGPVPLSLGDPGQEVTAETRNLSTTGVYCAIDQFIPPMTKLQLRFELPTGEGWVPVRCAGVVVRVEPVVTSPDRGRYHVAVFFTDIAETERSAISQFVAQRLAAQAG
jgi:hypothetical protein